MSIQATGLRVGMIIEHEGAVWQVMKVQHRTPGNKRGFMQTTMRNLKQGNQTEVKFSSNDKIEEARLVGRDMQFLYEEGEGYVFMDSENYEQITLGADLVKDGMLFVLPNTEVRVLFYEEQAFGLRLPKTVDLEVTETEPFLKGATATSSYKPAILETGLSVKVPPFVGVGELIRVDIEKREYLERVKK